MSFSDLFSRKNFVARALLWIGLIVICVGLVASVAFWKNEGEFSAVVVYVFAGCFFGGVFFIAMSEIIELLERIKEKIDEDLSAIRTGNIKLIKLAAASIAKDKPSEDPTAE